LGQDPIVLLNTGAITPAEYDKLRSIILKRPN
jgi:hypothetical protein